MTCDIGRRTDVFSISVKLRSCGLWLFDGQTDRWRSSVCRIALHDLPILFRCTADNRTSLSRSLSLFLYSVTVRSCGCSTDVEVLYNRIPIYLGLGLTI